jgi:cysteine desulfurase
VKNLIYLDHAAATPVSQRVLDAMQPFWTERFFNPSSPYLPAVEVRQTYETAKDDIAQAIGAKSSELIMTAGATESVNLAFTALSGLPQPRALVLAIEHPAVLEAAKRHEPDFIKVNQHGLIDLNDLAAKLTPDTALISVALANHELGTIQPISDIAQIVKTERLNRLQQGNNTPLYLHCDASQGFGLIDVNVARLGVDMLTLNSAKIYGPKQVGALYASRQVKLSPLIVGGGQQQGLRSGTENVAGVIGFAQAVKDTKKHVSSEKKRLQALKTALKRKLQADITPIEFLGNDKKQLASFVPILLPGIDAERLIFMLEAQGVLVATGSACAASKGTKSPVLDVIGVSDDDARGSLRLTLGKLNTPANIDKAAGIIAAAVKSERERVGKL